VSGWEVEIIYREFLERVFVRIFEGMELQMSLDLVILKIKRLIEDGYKMRIVARKTWICFEIDKLYVSYSQIDKLPLKELIIKYSGVTVVEDTDANDEIESTLTSVLDYYDKVQDKFFKDGMKDYFTN